ncbi:MAG TPA: hypothetical protein VJK71_04825 [Gemmatimonadales bacterium]|nr:hypothetical protein [Gemmatimonadales bacterium]
MGPPICCEQRCGAVGNSALEWFEILGDATPAVYAPPVAAVDVVALTADP